MLNRAQVNLSEELDAVISRSILEYDLTVADVVGALECVKYSFMRRVEDECERQEGDGDGAA